MSDQLTELLRSTQSKLTGVVGLQVCGVDGLSEAHTLEASSVNPTAAVSASSLQLGRRLADLLGEGALQEITVRSADGYVMVFAIEPAWVLTVLTVASANIALIKLECRDLRSQIEPMLAAVG